MGDGGAVEGHIHQVLLGILVGLTDGLGDFGSLAHASTNAAVLIADHDQSGEPHIAAALNGLGHAIDSDKLLFEFADLFVALHLRVSSF